jgi:hypothetical protein
VCVDRRFIFAPLIDDACSAVQICSAVQNQDFTVINDYITGLKVLSHSICWLAPFWPWLPVRP